MVVLYDVMLVNNWGTFLTALREFSTRSIDPHSLSIVSRGLCRSVQVEPIVPRQLVVLVQRLHSRTRTRLYR